MTVQAEPTPAAAAALGEDAARPRAATDADADGAPHTVFSATPSVAIASAPPIKRRLACFLYEGVLLFGVVMVVGLLYSTLTQQRHALTGTNGLRTALFVALALYFVFFWSRTGQTLAMQTWHIRLVTSTGQRVGAVRALCRYLLAWLWFLPALLALQISGLKGALPAFASMFAGVLAYAALAWLRADRQFWHDAVCSTRLVTWRPVRKARAGAAP